MPVSFSFRIHRYNVSALEGAEPIGIDKGGKEARKMKEPGLPGDVIMEVTGMSVHEIEKLYLFTR